MIKQSLNFSTWFAFIGLQTFTSIALAAAPPAAPSGLTPSAVSPTQVNLRWTDNSNNELGFYVERSLGSATQFSTVGSLAENSTSYQDSGLAANTKYNYRVAAYSKNKNGKPQLSYSSIVSVTTPSPVPPPTTTTSTTTTTTSTTTSTTTTSTSTSTTTTTTTMPQPPPPPAPTGSTLTNIQVQSLSSADQSNVPFTFGQVFIQGQLFSTDSLVGVLSNGSQVPLQMNVKATHADGSIRHAIISAVVPQLLAGQTLTVNLTKSSAEANPAGNPQDLINAGFSTDIALVVGGVTYTASANPALQSGAVKVWLSGSIANEWILVVPFKDASGNAHPHLMARFAVRSYAGLKKAKVDVTVENGWAYQPNPQNFLYDVQVNVGGQNVYSKTGLNHLHHARWKKTFWWGGAPLADVRLNGRYIINTKAVPNYDPAAAPTESYLASLATSYASSNTEPMGTGLAVAYMPTTGGRSDIGLNPSWAVAYMLSMDSRAKNATLGTATMGGSWSVHYRDQKTDRPLSINDYPYSTLLGRTGDTINPATGLSEAFPVCGGDCSTGSFGADSAHQPNLEYIAYLTTGDFYYLEEIQFYAMFNLFQHNPYYRQFSTGLVKADQTRGQAWTLRTLAETAYITPDNDSLKSQFTTFLNNNLDWYNAKYSNNPSANTLGVIEESAMVYNSGTGLAPWQDDFFTQAIGHAAELGFAKAKPLLAFKAQFSIGRMTAPGFCWIMASNYTLNVQATSAGPLYSTLGEAFQNTITDPVRSMTCNSPEMATALGLKVGEMVGYSSDNAGFPSDMQPALAYSVDSGIANGTLAWQIFMSRSVLPNYQTGPQFSVIPRK